MAKKYQHVIWDWNGTLFNDVWLCVKIMNGLLRKRKMDSITEDYYRSIFTFPVEDYYKKIGFDFSRESFENIGKEWMDEYEKNKHQCSLFDNSRELLTQIDSRGIGQSILSAYSHNTLIQLIDHFDISRYFEYVVGLDHIYADSKMGLGMELLKKINLDKNKLVLIGDTIHDLEVADSLGIDCIIISNGHQSRNQLGNLNTDVMESLNELFDKSHIYF